MYYNYKNYFSTVLFAMCDSNCGCTYIDIHYYGQSSDAEIFKNSFNKMCDGPLGVPLPWSIENLLRSYGSKYLTDNKKAFNYRSLLAQRYIECTFGIFTNKWRIFHRPTYVDIDFVESIVKTACVLPNFVRTRDGKREEAFFDDTIPQSNVQNLTPDARDRNLLAILGRYIKNDKLSTIIYYIKITLN